MGTKKKRISPENPSNEDDSPLISAIEEPVVEEYLKGRFEDKRRPNRKPLPQEIKLSARQFIRARGYRWERCAGFLHEMNQKGLGALTRSEWEKLWDTFWKRPVK